jgi:hypothetical protein
VCAHDPGGDWHTNMDAGMTVDGQLGDDVHRYGRVTVLGVGETLFAKLGPFHVMCLANQALNGRRRRATSPTS